ncbi:MAG: hypothetical protein A2Z21_01610 [Candidatus Fraserbacteria bacterium RBG_16_55_9]|uniref:DUF503 domain-containing protein n=1 Tax=Fraserbacteria sp. (strain RBG_16_55_9) TaxID=1817864 RepID=A0A1F5UX02_FRAXR|nr:MAG: hypothetical protein A2Z21_01610 [Candidatus Fraserbacteria bacterium RBG_16_55_9]
MRVATARITLRLPQTSSLKDKRRILKSLIARVKHEFNVSISEVDELDNRRMAVLGVAFVSNDGQLNQRVIHRLVALIGHDPEILVEDSQSEVF